MSKVDDALSAFQAMRSNPDVQPQRTGDLLTLIKQLAPEIQDLYQEGYSLAQICSSLETKDIHISQKTLRQYLSRLGYGLRAAKEKNAGAKKKPSREKDKQQKRTKGKSQPPQPPQPPAEQDTGAPSQDTGAPSSAPDQPQEQPASQEQPQPSQASQPSQTDAARSPAQAPAPDQAPAESKLTQLTGKVDINNKYANDFRR